MLDLFKKNSFLLGFVLAGVVPVILFFTLDYSVHLLSVKLTQGFPLIRYHNIMLVSIFLNLLIFKNYLHKPNHDRTGKGVMIITFILTLAYFIWRFGYLVS
jgi:hypothetical protein